MSGINRLAAAATQAKGGTMKAYEANIKNPGTLMDKYPVKKKKR